MEDWKQAQLYFYWILITLLEFSLASADPQEAFFIYVLYFSSRLIVNYWSSHELKCEQKYVWTVVFFMITLFLQFKNSKCFKSLIVINREENSTLLEQLICRDPGSKPGPLDLQSNALPTELSRLEKLTTDFRQVFQCLPKIFYFYIIKPMEDWKQAQLYLYWILTLLEFSRASADPQEAFFIYVLYFSSRLIVNYWSSHELKCEQKYVWTVVFLW